MRHSTDVSDAVARSRENARIVQGYLAVDSLWLAKNKGAMPGGGEPVLTGPAFIDKGNVDLLEGQSR